MAKEPEVTDELLAKRWPAKFAGKCNICRQSYPEGEKVGIDPAKPFWYNDKAKKYAYNYAHEGCIGKGSRMLNNEPEHAADVKPFSFDPRNEDKFTQFIRELRSLCEAYLA